MVFMLLTVSHVYGEFSSCFIDQGQGKLGNEKYVASDQWLVEKVKSGR
jgi:hypothetical protein